ncbi:undecaprenyl-diphosphatase UppP [Patescibacteria group bacterium]|nr:undecaprenyl-diphosphatase UppP [Patescibacteria group bacterium]
MSLLQALILGIVQGLTEFLPVSSSGHLVIFPAIFGWNEQPLVFDTTLHLGTVLALVIYFRKDIVRMLVKDKDLGLKILLGSIPAGVLGLLFNSFIETHLRNVFSVIIFLSAGSLLMLLAEHKFRAPLKGTITYRKSFKIGVFQALALLPGMSRSAASISGGMLNNLRHVDAARFSFLLSIPIVLAAGVYKLIQSVQAGYVFGGTLFVGFIASFLFGLLAIDFFMNFLKKNRLFIFIAYRLFLVSVLIFFVALKAKVS